MARNRSQILQFAMSSMREREWASKCDIRVVMSDIRVYIQSSVAIQIGNACQAVLWFTVGEPGSKRWFFYDIYDWIIEIVAASKESHIDWIHISQENSVIKRVISICGFMTSHNQSKAIEWKLSKNTDHVSTRRARVGHADAYARVGHADIYAYLCPDVLQTLFYGNASLQQPAQHQQHTMTSQSLPRHLWRQRNDSNTNIESPQRL